MDYIDSKGGAMRQPQFSMAVNQAPQSVDSKFMSARTGAPDEEKTIGKYVILGKIG